MTPTQTFFQRHALLIGIILMFLLTWPVDLANAGLLPFQVPLAAAIFVGYGFVIASLLMTGLTLGRDGVIRLLRRFLIWRVGWNWYAVAFLLIPTLSLVGLLLDAWLRQTPLDFSRVLAYEMFGPSVNLLLLVVPFFLFDAIANGEEIGWRGYILPRLQVKQSALTASLIIGLLWGIWHIPKFLGHWDSVAFAWFMVDVMAKSVLLAWMYNNTKGSLLLVTLFHASFNTVGVFLPVANTMTDGNISARIIITLLEVMVAVVVISQTKTEQLSLRVPRQAQV
jgi:uncharacterized protein